MSADRYEITDTNGLRIDGIPWRERGLLVQYAAIRQQARDIAELRAELQMCCELKREYQERAAVAAEQADQLRADLAAAVAARANMETDLELAHFAAMKESEWKPRAETADTTGRLAA